jgi:hypothetical protein
MIKKLIIIFILSLWAVAIFGQTQTDHAHATRNEFASIAKVYMKFGEPYFEKFAKAQYPDNEIMQTSTKFMYQQKAVGIENEILKSITTSELGNPVTYTKEDYAAMLEISYRYNFPGLDVAYFDMVSRDVKQLLLTRQ